MQDAVNERIFGLRDCRAAGDVGGLGLQAGDLGDRGDLGVFDGHLGVGEAGLDLEFGAGAILVSGSDGGLGGGEGGLEFKLRLLGFGRRGGGLGPGGTEGGFGLELTELEGLRQRGETSLRRGEFETRADDVGLDLGLDGLRGLLDRALLGHDERCEEKRDKGQARHGGKECFDRYMVPLKPIFGKSARMEADAPITLLNRHTGRMETEQVYGEKWLRRIYGNPLGKLTLHTVVKRALFSKLYGWAMDRPSSARRVAPFVKAFGLDPAEFADSDLNSYRTFNDFFYRKLKDSARPVDPRAEMAVLPADGRHLGFPDASRVNGIFAKGQTFDMAALVADRALGERYARGTVVCSRLCPVDYHRFHFPVPGVPGQPVLAQGQLYSVNPIALRRSAAYLWQNKRQRVTIDAGPFGLVTMVSVGATNVGTIIETYQPGQQVAKGDEKGYFRFGGSFVATIFEPGRIKLEDDLIHAGETAVEVYAKVGSPLGRLA